MRLFPKDKNNQCVAVFDADAQVFEIFTEKDCSSYIGCADTVNEAKAISQDWVIERSL
jgi:putative methionine-R-sulfoxide reductase with GAF domain